MLYLASASPRRREILQMAGERFEVVPSHGDESRPPELSPGELVQELARRKAFAAEVSPGPGDIVLGADTLVALDGRLWEMPLRRGRPFLCFRHFPAGAQGVYGCCLRTAGRSETFVSEAEVEFYPLTEEEIRAYIATGEPMDKAVPMASRAGAACWLGGSGGIIIP